ncbi:MAG: IPT/TIG domain-containing protein, partial [Acidobacteriota bacterium]|nr:IPT/TIG domain-containing protein [Acidobacteriota bacterium]
GQWTFDFAKTDGYGSYPAGFGQIFLAPVGSGCPTVPDGNPAHQDQTFDLNYAAPGSVVIDSSSGPGNLLMIYEGTNTCFGVAGGPRSPEFYSTVGVATSQDYGRTWPTYRGNSAFSFVPLPSQNTSRGPEAPLGALGNSVCIGNDCSAAPPASYGRYGVLSPSVSLATAMATGKPLSSTLGDAELSAFADDAASSAQDLYVVYDYHPGAGALADPRAPKDDLMIARAKLNGGSAPLSFLKWNGQAFNSPGLGGLDTPVFPAGPFENCEASGQNRFGGSISFVEDTQQYLLTFVCTSPSDPAGGSGAAPKKGAAWFYSTGYDLSDPRQFTQPQEIIGSWNEFDNSGGCPDYQGWYPSFMSPGKKPGHLSTSGYAFYLSGCQTSNTPPPGRRYSSRAFTITTGPAGPTLAAGTLANGATYLAGGLVPGSWAQVKGSNLSNVSRTWGDSDFAGLDNKLPTNLGGVEVKVNGAAAAVYYISPTQVSFQVPSGITGTASVQVVNNGVASNVVTATAAANSPGIFPVILNGTNYAAGVFLDGKLVGDPSVSPAFRKAKPGEVIQLFVTGLVPTPAGVLPIAQSVSGVTVAVDDITVPADFVGLVAVGEFQINFKVPQQFANRAEGTYPISVQVNGVSSPPTINTNPPGPVIISIQH